MESKIEFEIVTEHREYDDVRTVIQKICEDHEDKRDLHIAVKLINPPIIVQQNPNS